MFVDMLGAILAPLAPGVRVPEELLEVRNMLSTRWEVWERKRQEDLQLAVDKAVQAAEQMAGQAGEQRGEAKLLVRQ